ncbi:MAG: esterase/lipase [Flavobacteriaceae bacterium]|jgi:esterase/lipase
MVLKLIKAYFTVSSILAPRITGRRSFRLFQKVRIKKIRNRELAFYETATKFTVPNQIEDIDCYEFGEPNGNLILLVHGWESNAGSMSKLAIRFSELGYLVVAFNLPGHAHYKMSSTTLLECVTAMKNVLDYLNPSTPISVVSHSFGSAVVANALSRSSYPVDSLVFLTSHCRIEDIFLEFKSMISLGDKAYKSLIKKTEKMLGNDLASLDVDVNVNKIGHNKLLLIHDKKDRVLPYSNSQRINENTTDTSLITLEKAGHYKMLWSDEVIEHAVSFVFENVREAITPST